jgi:hypothetical protein
MCSTKTTKATHTGRTKEPLTTHRRKAAVLRNPLQLNRGFEQVLEQFQQLDKVGLGHQRWNASRVMANENRTESTSN